MDRLQKVLAQAGIASRRKCEEYITAGRVTVNDKLVKELGAKVDPDKDEIRVDGKPVKLERKLYLMLNKPKGGHYERCRSRRAAGCDRLFEGHRRAGLSDRPS